MNKLIDCIQDIYYSIIGRIECKYNEFKGRCLRFKRGYSYGDVWDMNDWFIRTIRPMLIHLRDHGIGAPGHLYVEGAENEREKWEAVLSEMIDCLYLMDEANVVKHLGLDELHLPLDKHELINNTVMRNKNRFFDLFSEYFYYLWD